MNVPIYEERLQHDLEKIREMVVDLSTKVQHALRQALHALLTHDSHLANQVVLNDNPINRQVIEIDMSCHYFVAKHLPSAGHLRFVSSVMRLMVILERLGDYAVTICRETVQLSKPLRQTVRQEAKRMANDSFDMLNQALTAFHEDNADLARGTKSLSKHVDRTFASIFEELVEIADKGKRNSADIFGMLTIFNALERVSDQAKNICEMAVFAATGEVKPRKVYQILFLDRGDQSLALMAQAIAHKRFPGSGVYSIGGKSGSPPDPTFVKLMEEHGHQTPSQSSCVVPDEWPRFHVMVCLQGKISDYGARIPFHCAVLEWNLPHDQLGDSEVFHQVHSQLSQQIEDLIILLRGEANAN